MTETWRPALTARLFVDLSDDIQLDDPYAARRRALDVLQGVPPGLITELRVGRSRLVAHDVIEVFAQADVGHVVITGSDPAVVDLWMAALRPDVDRYDDDSGWLLLGQRIGGGS